MTTQTKQSTIIQNADSGAHGDRDRAINTKVSIDTFVQ